MLDYRDKIKKEIESIVGKLSSDIALLHSSRATPALVEDIVVSAYGQKMPLKQLASLSAPDARTIVAQPWDSSTIPEIQKAIELSHVWLGITVEERFLRLTLPQLSEERRNEIVRVLGKRVEETRIAIRYARGHVMKSLEGSCRAKEISEDEKFRIKEALQKVVDEYMDRVEDLQHKKEQEILG